MGRAFQVVNSMQYTGSRRQEIKPKRAIAAQAKSSKGKELVLHKGKEVDPEEAIPLEDDFKDF